MSTFLSEAPRFVNLVSLLLSCALFFSLGKSEAQAFSFLFLLSVLCVSGFLHRGDVSSFCFPVSLSILILFILLALYTPNGCDFPFSQHEKEKLFFF